MPAAPIVKYVGGKTKLLPELLPRLPKMWLRYWEPFVGGAALFFAVEPKDAVLADANEHLMGMYRAVASSVEEVISELRAHKRRHAVDAKTHYYATRQAWNKGEFNRPASRAAAFIYLNKTCYNGLWRVNRGGGYNVPMGRYADPPICNEDALRAAAPVLARARLAVGGFAETTAEAGSGDFVYFDPPYDPVSKTASFTAYSKGGFGRAEQEALAAEARRLVDCGAQVMLSNSDTPFIRSLYQGFRIDTVRCPRAINSKGDKRDAVDEVVICGGYG